MANNRELSQLGSIINIDNSNKSVGFGASVGIGTNQPGYKLDVKGDVNFDGDLYQNGQLFTCLLYTSPSPRDLSTSRMPSSA